MGVSLAARSLPSADHTERHESAGQPGRERGGNGLPKKPARARVSTRRMKGTALIMCWLCQLVGVAGGGRKADVGTRKEREALALQVGFGDRLVKKQAYPRPDRQLLGFPISSKLPPVFGPSCMRQKLVPRTVRRPSPTPAVRVRLRSTNTKKIQFTQRLPLGSELHMGKERCCLRGLDHLHGPTFHSICGNLMIYKPSLTAISSCLSMMNHFVPTSVANPLSGLI
ncbi:hypothetical protein HAX54_022272 [Datura stramonium]|uniref:Uncharacterized protein n=1 Tax=Datura stramonium TaxID=4076 RepID=A0ABS8S3W6_DATST|nr:hypothetical protein [Datura stramonium]